MIPALSHLSVYLLQASSVQADHAGQTSCFACEGKQHFIAHISSSKLYPLIRGSPGLCSSLERVCVSSYPLKHAQTLLSGSMEVLPGGINQNHAGHMLMVKEYSQI